MQILRPHGFLTRAKERRLSISYRCTVEIIQLSGRVYLHTGVICGKCEKDSLAKNHYQVLGVSRNATKQEIRTAFVTLSKKYHPDSNPEQNKEAKNVDSQSFVAVSEAYRILNNPSSKARYDNELTVAERYRTQYEQRFYNGSSSDDASQHDKPFTTDRYNTYSPGRGAMENEREVDWELYRKSLRKPNHSRVLYMLLAVTFMVPVLFMLRINHNYHKYYQPAAILQSQRNVAAYEAVRDRARSTSVQEQLDLLVERHGNRTKDVNKCTPNNR